MDSVLPMDSRILINAALKEVLMPSAKNALQGFISKTTDAKGTLWLVVLLSLVPAARPVEMVTL
jgi:hypothetical protein